MRMVIPFLREGLTRGERCIYIADDRTTEELMQALNAAGIEVAAAQARGALIVLTKRETYLRSGEFDPDHMLAFLRESTNQALADNFTGLRITGEMTWALGPEVGCDRLIEYETLLSQFFSEGRALVLCQYNRARFPPELILDVLRTHPIVVYDNQVFSNFYYELPDMVFGNASVAQRVEWMLATMVQARAKTLALQEAEEFNRGIVESSFDCIKVLDLEANLLSIGPGGRQLLELTEFDQPLGTCWLDLWHNGDRVAATEAVAAARRGDMGRFQGYCPTATGKPKWWDVVITPIRNPRGKPEKLLAISRDVTEQKHVEQAHRLLADAGRLFAETLDYECTLRRVAQLAVSVLADGSFFDLVTPSNQIQRVAAAYRDDQVPDAIAQLLLHVPPGNVTAHPVTKVLRSGRSEYVPRIDDAWMRTVAISPEHLEFLRQLQLHSLMAVPLSTHGHVIGSLVLFRTTTMIPYEEEDLRLAEELASRAALAIENARLHHELREEARRKDEFLAMLAHELRNPLASISMSSYILNELAPPDSRARRLNGTIHRQTQHLSRLVDDLLDISRITRGKIELHKRPVELTAILTEAFAAVEPSLTAQGHTFSISLPQTPDETEALWLHADPTRLVQVVTNILHNAIKYTPPGGAIQVEVERDGDTAVIRVRDTGIGIAADLLPHIFDLFTQGKRAPDRQEGGLGIGLALVRKLVEMHDGNIHAYSAGPEQGSEFVIRLPLLQNVTPSHHDSSKAAVTSTTQSRSILIVEDREEAASTLADLLQFWGYQVRTAPDGPTALEMLSKHCPDAILLDIGLPQMDGYELARHIRQQANTAHVPLVALTGYGQPEDRNRSAEAGFNHHLVKPVDPEALRTLLAMIIPETDG